MKAALIPPIPHLYMFAEEERFHLVLSHLLTNAAYYNFYRDMRLRGSYLVLDNGAHENTAGETMRDLLAKAVMLRVDEVVLPDTLFDADATIKGARDALACLISEGPDIVGERPFPRLMLVPQGRTFEDWKRCFNEMIEAYMRTWVDRRDLTQRYPVIGISKDYDYWDHSFFGVLSFLEGLREWMTFDVHLLGWARDLRILSHLATRYPWIRSTDSAKPFVYALHGIDIRPGDSPEYPRRPRDYFYARMNTLQQRTALRNIRTFKEVARDTSR